MFTLRHSALKAGHAFRPTLQARLASTNSPTPLNSLKKGLYTTVFVVSVGLFAVYYFDSRSAIHRWIITPTLRYAFDPETSHRLAVRALASGLGPRDTQVDDERLKSEVFATPTASEAHFNPVKLALGNRSIQSNRASCRV
jgi:dihydroorotate dehydrogenase